MLEMVVGVVDMVSVTLKELPVSVKKDGLENSVQQVMNI
jgi:hypothetical protein